MGKIGIILLVCSIVIIIIICLLIIFKKKNKIVNLNEILLNTKEFSVEEFFVHRENIMKNYQHHLQLNGAYVLYNKNKHLYYVGQSKNVINRIHQHFTGHGNGDVYADYKYHDQFGIKYILLSQTNYKNLNELERKLILCYQSYGKGYNKTKGNNEYEKH